jgi:hypothetical protein
MDRYRTPASCCGSIGVGPVGSLPVAVAVLARRPDPREGKDDNSLRDWGMALLRAARPAEAVDKLEQSLRLQRDRGDDAHNELALALAHHQLGHADEARRWQQAAAAIMERYRAPASACGTLGVGPVGALPVGAALLAERPDPRSGKDDNSLRDWLEMDLLRAEIERALVGKSKP